MVNPINEMSGVMIKTLLAEIEKHYDSDCLCINGPISSGLVKYAKEEVERLKSGTDTHKKLMIVLTTDGGDANTVERLVNIFRHHYQEVNFIIPDHAYSAGTILCMSGDNIYMDYASVLGPIDPQVQNKEGRFVPALGYLEKIKALLDKAQNNTLSQAEFLILKDFDLAEISLYEQARDLTSDLLKKWLVKYKFKNWNTHRLSNEPVTEAEKEQRAEDIAKELANYERWKTHGRSLGIDTLRELKLRIEDYGTDIKIKNAISELHNIIEDYMRINNADSFIASRRILS